MDWLDRIWTLLPWAFSAGMLATVNPCGFAMLPAYLSYLLGRTDGPFLARNLIRSGGAGLSMTGGVLGVFLTAGTIITAVGSTLLRFVPAVGVIVGVAVAGVGLAMLLRPTLHISVRVPQFAAEGPDRIQGFRFVIFGAGYGFSSLSCTLPIFLVVTAQALAAGGILPGLLVFIAYALGMGAVLITLSLSIGGGSTFLVRRLRALAPVLRELGAAGMVAAGTYLAYYQVTYGRLLLSRP